MMKVSVLHVVFVLAVPTFVFANPPFGGGGTTRIVKDIVGGGATIYHSDGTTSRYDANPLGGGGTIHHTGGGTTRVVNDLMGGGATFYNSNGSTSRYNANPLGGGATIHSFGGASRPYGSGLDVHSMGANVSGFRSSSGAYSSPSLTDYDVGGSGIDMPLSTYQRGASSRPVIEGYKYIGEDKSSFGDMVENAAIQAACYYGAKALVKAFSDGNEAFGDGNEANTPVGYDSSYRQFEKRSWGWVRWVSLFFYIIALTLVVGFVLVRMGNKKWLNLQESIFDKEEYGRRCVIWRDSHTRRDLQGCLASVETPAALKKLICGIYAICALPGVVALWKIDWCNFKIAWNSYSWMVLVGCLILMVLPVSLHRGKSFARSVVVFVCAAVIVCFAVIGLVGTFAEDDGDTLLVVLIISVLAMSFFCYLIIILVSPSTDEWLRMKKELKLENSRRRVMAIKAMGHRIISSRACLFVEKWYMWIAVVLILICFVVIFRGLFSPLSSEASDAEKRRMAYGRHERMKQIKSPDVQGAVALP